MIAAWSARRPIATQAVGRALAERGIVADYTIDDIGFRTQRIRNVRLGNPASPDLTADWVEVTLAPYWGGVTVTMLKAHGVRLRGRLVEGRLDFGMVDRLLPASGDKGFVLPRIDVALDDIGIGLETPYGPIGIALAGKGPLQDGFRGRARIVGRDLGTRDCHAGDANAELSVRVDAGRPALVGPVAAVGLACAGMTIPKASGRIDAALSGAMITGRYRLATTRARYDRATLAGIEIDGRYRIGDVTDVTGKARVARVTADADVYRSAIVALNDASATPIGPLVQRLTRAIDSAASGVAATTDFAVRRAADRLTVRLSNARLEGPRGLRATLDLPGNLASREPGRAVLRLSGGGFPTLHVDMRRFHAGWRGSVAMAPFAAGGARLAVTPVQVAVDRNGSVALSSIVLIDGPIGDGRVDGLRLPLTIRRFASGEIVAAPGCTPVSYRQVTIAGSTFAPAALTLCPIRGGALFRSTSAGVSGGARTGPLRIVGRAGDQPLSLTSSAASVDLRGLLALADFSARIGSGDDAAQLRAARIDGSTRGAALSGSFSGLEGRLARVPLDVSGGRGTWRFAQGRLAASGGFVVTDTQGDARFNPVSADHVTLQFGGNRVAATATLREPRSNRAIASVDLTHDLTSANGRVDFKVDGLIFGKSLQPEALTRLTVGVVADVQGRVDGGGTIRWSRDRVTSDGRFTTRGLDLAAAFGPVSGVSGTIVFDDLLALSTPSNQQIQVALINPGVEVRDGEIGFRLRPGQIVEIERGRWPFAGGALVLDPASLDFGQDTARTLAFRVTALDAAKFIEQLKLENIAATGVFDGVLPIVFDKSGGRIVGGKLLARAGGGTLAYVGDVSNAQTNAMTRLAFDALKAIRYDRLAIELDGALDGEIVSRVLFYGVNEAPVAPTGLARSFVGLPFKFNIAVRAPFRGLVNQARSFQDPGLLLNRPVQPPESAKAP